jgi:FtsH-binding integral membrane protein
LVRNTKNKPARIILYTLGTLGLGMSISPLFNEINPELIASALAITGGLFGGASLVAYSLPKNKLFSYRHTLQGALLGLCGMQLVSLFIYLVWG